MKISRYFCELYALYEAEIDDLSENTEGANVLIERIAEKRQQLSLLLPMMESNPEMIAPAFHGALSFSQTNVWEKALSVNDSILPTWESLKNDVTIDRWTRSVLPEILNKSGGEAFWIKVCALEFMWQHHVNVRTHMEKETIDKKAEDGEHLSDEYDRNEDAAHCEDKDLGEAGDSWLEQQGFDSRKG